MYVIYRPILHINHTMTYYSCDIGIVIDTDTNNDTNTNGNEDAQIILERVSERQQQIIDSYTLEESCKSDVQYYGWFSEEVQAKRAENPTQHKQLKHSSHPGAITRTIKSPPYTYWIRDGEKVLVTDVTCSIEITERHKETHALFLGKLDKFCCRSYTKLYL